MDRAGKSASMIALSTALQATICSYLSIKQRFAVLSRVNSSFRSLLRNPLSWGDRDEYITFARGNPTAAFMLDRLRCARIVLLWFPSADQIWQLRCVAPVQAAAAGDCVPPPALDGGR
jgi:hypothetical protein